MKKLVLTIIVTLFFTSIVYAQESKVITLKDGSILNGKVIQLSDGIYTLETSNLGNIKIAEKDVLTIASPKAQGTSKQNAQMKSQVEQLQGTILSNGDLMTDIETLVNDEEIKAMLSDPQLMDAVMSFDQEKLQKNSNVQDLINNPKIQELMNKIQKKIPVE